MGTSNAICHIDQLCIHEAMDATQMSDFKTLHEHCPHSASAILIVLSISDLEIHKRQELTYVFLVHPKLFIILRAES